MDPALKVFWPLNCQVGFTQDRQRDGTQNYLFQHTGDTGTRNKDLKSVKEKMVGSERRKITASIG